MNPKRRRRSLKRKYKGVVAAMAGAAVLSTSLLPGLPVTRAHAAILPTELPTTQVSHTENSPIPKKETSRDSASPIEATRRHAPLSDPVRVVRNNAATYGFNASNDTFSLLSQTGGKAVVQVRTSGQTFKVDLEKSGNSWEIKTIRGIGNMKYPATYTPASMFRYHAPAPSPIIIPAEQTTIYQTDDYKNWSWNQTLYPQDMNFGVVLTVSQVVGSTIFIPDYVKEQTKNVDFNRELILFAHLGSAPSQGYGIAIEKVAQSGNSLIVTIAAKSPLAGEKLTTSKLDDYILFNRSTLNFNRPIQILFIDRNGTPLSNYIILPH